MTEPTILPVDREAAAEAYRGSKNHDWQNRVRTGQADDGYMVQAFARHRELGKAAGRDAMKAAGLNNWDGLARQIMMAYDMGCKTPRQILKHLDRVTEIPQWLRDEPEMQHLDHIPSKGTRAVLIYRAMTEGIQSNVHTDATVHKEADDV